MSIDFLTTDFERVSYLRNILVAHATGKPAETSEYEELRRMLLNSPSIAGLLPAWIRTIRDLDAFWGFIQPKYKTYAERRSFLSAEFTPVLDELEFHKHNTNQTAQSDFSQNNSRVVARNKRKVFIVHGRDNGIKQEVGRFVESLGLEAIILHEQASAGMTIIEKIEHYSNDADFALVLYTACDEGRGIHERKTSGPKNRARQNVVFEHGYFMAALGRENVCALVQGDIETPNDLSGVVYVELDQQGAWKSAVKKELLACGYTLKSDI